MVVVFVCGYYIMYVTIKQLIPATAAVIVVIHIMYIIQPGLVRPILPPLLLVDNNDLIDRAWP